MIIVDYNINKNKESHKKFWMLVAMTTGMELNLNMALKTLATLQLKMPSDKIFIG